MGGFLGWSAFGPLGALLGFAIGAFFDSTISANETGYSRLANGLNAEGERNSFLVSMLVLSAYIIKADGKVMHSEMELVRNMLRQNFGNEAAQEGDQFLRRLFEEQKNMGNAAFRERIRLCCQQVAIHVDYSGRLQLLNFLVLIAQADGHVDPSEVTALKEIAQWMQMSPQEVDAMLHLKGESIDDAYQVMGVSPDATDDELKKAYRRLA